MLGGRNGRAAGGAGFLSILGCAAAASLLLAGSAAAAMSPDVARRAGLLDQQKNWPALLALATQAERDDPGDGWAAYYAGLAYDGLGRRREAAASYEAALPRVITYMRENVAQLLAADYAALGEPGKLRALYRREQAGDPQTAALLRSQYSAAIETGVVAAIPAGTWPDVSPRSLAALTAKVRQSWAPDATPMSVTVDAFDRGAGTEYQAAYRFYSPTTRKGLDVALSAAAATTSPDPDARGGTPPIAADFLPLAEAAKRVAGLRSPDDLRTAELYRQSADPADPIGLVWDLLPKGGDDVLVPAYRMPQAEFARLQASASAGDAAAAYRLAEVYASGVAGVTDAARTLAWMKTAAQRGDLPAENALGQYFEFGIGVPADAATAAAWYRKAALAGFPPAEFNLGLLYETGHGVPQDWSAADRWISAAAPQVPDAQLELPLVRRSARRQQHAAALAARQALVYRRSGAPSAAAMIWGMNHAVHPNLPANRWD